MGKFDERGPIYGTELIDSLPIGTSGFRQAMPCRDDLCEVCSRNERVVAGYEILLRHFLNAVEEIDHAIDRLDPAMARHEIVELRERLIRQKSSMQN